MSQHTVCFCTFAWDWINKINVSASLNTELNQEISEVLKNACLLNSVFVCLLVCLLACLPCHITDLDICMKGRGFLKWKNETHLLVRNSFQILWILVLLSSAAPWFSKYFIIQCFRNWNRSFIINCAAKIIFSIFWKDN